MHPRGTLLLVDDDDGVRAGLALALEDHGWSVTAVADPLTAVLALVEQVPDVAVLDLMLPDFLGDALLLLLRHHAPLMPAVIITGFRDVVTPARLRRLGEVPVLEKPFDTCDLDRICQDQMAGCRQSRIPLPVLTPSLTRIMDDLCLLADDPDDAQLLSRCIVSLGRLHEPAFGTTTTAFDRLAEASSIILATLTTGDAFQGDAERVITGISTLGVLLSRAPGQPGQGTPRQNDASVATSMIGHDSAVCSQSAICLQGMMS